MVFITEKKERNASNFFYHRVARVAPPYWVVTFLMALLIITIPRIMPTYKLTIDHLLASIFFVAYPHPASGAATPLYLPGWTLNYEFFFYFIFAAGLMINAKARVLLVSSILTTLVAVGIFLPVDNYLYRFYTNPILVEFVFGMIIAYAVCNGMIPRRTISISMIALGIGGLIASALFGDISRMEDGRFFFWGTPAALFVAGATCIQLGSRPQQITFLSILGDASYAIYLTHVFVVGAIAYFWNLLGLRDLASDFVLLVIAVFTSILVGLSFHFLIEVRLQSYFLQLGTLFKNRVGRP
jgi:exopolysaccharide production protein ExoZ